MTTIGDTSAFEAFEAEGWERQADGYDALMAGMTGCTAGPVLDAAGVGAGTRVLDVATGPGTLAGLAAGRGAAATGVDISAAMVAIARRRWPGASFRQADAHDLPFGAASFDAVTANFAIVHLGRPGRAVAEMARVLVPGGALALTSWDEPARVALFGTVLDALADCGVGPAPGVPAGPPFFGFADPGRLRALLGGAGFTDVRVDTLSFTHPVGGPDAAWEAVVAGTVRMSALVAGLPAETRERVRRAFAARLERHRRPDHPGLDLPVSVRLACGRTPA